MLYTLNTPIDMLPFPVQRLSDEARTLWLTTYVEVYEQTQDERKAEAGAWGAVKRESVLRDLGMKSVDGKTIIGGWSNLFTDENNRDLVKTYFDENTDYALDYYPSAPLLYEHDANFGIIGKRVHTEVFPHGIWMEHELHADSPHYNKIVSELEQGVLYYSTDSISHVVAEGYEPKDGYLGLWFLAGCSLTQNPAEPGLGPVTFSGVMNAIKSAKEKREASADDMPTSLESVNPVKDNNIMDLAQLAVLLGLAETATQEEVVNRIQSLLSASPEKMNGEEDPENTKNLQVLEMVRQALGAESGTPPSDDELRTILASALEMLGGEVEMEEPVVASTPEAMATAAKSVVESLRNSKKQVTHYPAFAINQEKRQTGTKSWGLGNSNNGRGFGTPIAKKDSVSVFAEGVIALTKGDSRKLQNLGFKSSSRSFSYNTGATGGWLPDREVSSDLIKLFYAQSVVLEAGATVVPMPGVETMTYRKMLTGATARWAAAGQTNTNSEATFGLVELNLRQAVGDMRLPNRLLKNAKSVDIERLLIEDLSKAISLLVDLSALRGTGAKPSGSAGRELLGIRYTPNVTITALSSAGRAPKPQDFVDAWGRIEDDNVPASNTWKHIMSPRTKRLIKNTKDTTGQAVPMEAYTQEYDVLATTQIPNTLTSTTGGNTDCSEIYFGDWQYLIFGVGQDIEIRVDTSRYIDSDETYIRADMMIDVAVSHTEAFEVLTNVRPVG